MGIRFVVVDGRYEVNPPTIFMLGRLMRSSSQSSLSTLLASLQDPDMLELFDDLDIGTANKTELFDVLDADLSAELVVHEVVSGLICTVGCPGHDEYDPEYL